MLFKIMFLTAWTFADFALSRGHEFEMCSPEDQEQIFSSPDYPCEPRPVVVDLKHHITNVTEVVSIIPDMVQVNRCGGNCPQVSYRCVPASMRLKSIPVMFIMSTLVNNINDQLCGNVTVEEHDSCECGCPMKEEDCFVKGLQVPERVFDPDYCKCRCLNNPEKLECSLVGREWDENTCRCMCPTSSWHHCSSGYTFDHEHTCRCVPINMTASIGLIAALVVLLMCVLATAIGFYTMYKKQTGLFKHLRGEDRVHLETQRLSLSGKLPENEMNVLTQKSNIKA